jgi:hypothetical protein
VPKCLEIKLEALAVGEPAREPAAELQRIARRQLAVADVGRELDHTSVGEVEHVAVGQRSLA